MKLIVSNSNHKQTIVFIHGFGKNYDDFNTTCHGKKISIEETMKAICNTIRIQIEPDDYCESVPDICSKIFLMLDESIIKTKITIVAHSHGCFNAIYLAKQYPNIFNRILLLDPTVKSESYRTQLVQNCRGYDNTTIEYHKVKNFDLLPDSKIPAKIIVRIHTNIKTDNLSDGDFGNKLAALYSMINLNAKSRFVVHVDKSHMIHYDVPATIIDSIKELYKL